jgi:hypothetical protein
MNPAAKFVADITGKSNNARTIVDFLGEHDLIDASERTCEKCVRPMYMGNYPTRGYSWRCGKCTTYRSALGNSLFSHARLRIWQILLIIYHWAFEASYTTISLHLDISAHTVSSYCKKLRLIAVQELDKTSIRLGGHGHIVEIDESLFVRVKHFRESDMLRPKVWVFGLYQRPTADSPKKVLFFKVAKRDAVTLLNIIYKHVEPGTIIHSDCWAAYNHNGESGKRVVQKNGRSESNLPAILSGSVLLAIKQ